MCNFLHYIPFRPSNLKSCTRGYSTGCATEAKPQLQWLGQLFGHGDKKGATNMLTSMFREQNNPAVRCFAFKTRSLQLASSGHLIAV